MEIDKADSHIPSAPATANLIEIQKRKAKSVSPTLRSLQAHLSIGKDCDANLRWPDVLAKRLDADKTTAKLGVLNEGISGNRVLHVRPGLDCCPGRMVGMAVDDTRLRKTGHAIPGASYQRDPLSPPYHTNFMLGLRFLQTSLLLPLHRDGNTACRALPVRIEEVPVVMKPGKRAPAEDWKQFYQARKQHNLLSHFVQIMPVLRNSLNQAGGAHKQLALAVDGSFCNHTVFAASVDGIALIARTAQKCCGCSADGSGRA